MNPNEPATHAGNEQYTKLKADFDQLAEQVKSMAGGKLAALRDGAMRTGKEAIDRVTHCVEEHPLRSMLIAAGVGALIGFLATRR